MERFGIAYYRGLVLQRIDLLSSSGDKALNQAAINTVIELAPFAPFPSTLAITTAELAIVRTWRFRR